jgi:hypothetical protein
VAGKLTKGDAHRRRGRQRGCDNDAAGLGLLRHWRLDEEAGECEGGGEGARPCSLRGKRGAQGGNLGPAATVAF